MELSCKAGMCCPACARRTTALRDGHLAVRPDQAERLKQMHERVLGRGADHSVAPWNQPVEAAAVPLVARRSARRRKAVQARSVEPLHDVVLSDAHEARDRTMGDACRFQLGRGEGEEVARDVGSRVGCLGELDVVERNVLWMQDELELHARTHRPRGEGQDGDLARRRDQVRRDHVEGERIDRIEPRWRRDRHLQRPGDVIRGEHEVLIGHGERAAVDAPYDWQRRRSEQIDLFADTELRSGAVCGCRRLSEMIDLQCDDLQRADLGLNSGTALAADGQRDGVLAGCFVRVSDVRADPLSAIAEIHSNFGVQRSVVAVARYVKMAVPFLMSRHFSCGWSSTCA